MNQTDDKALAQAIGILMRAFGAIRIQDVEAAETTHNALVYLSRQFYGPVKRHYGV